MSPAVVLALVAQTAVDKPVTCIAMRGTERAMVRAMGACIVRRWPAQSRAIVLARRSGEIAPLLRKMDMGDCMSPELLRRSNTVRFGSYSFSGMLAEELTKRDLLSARLPDLSTVARAEADAPPTVDTSKVAGDQADAVRNEWAIRVIGECAVRLRPDAARTLVFSTIGSAEDAAITAFVPAISSCMPPKTETRFGRESVRALTALSYYRLANVAGVLPQSKN